MLHYRIVLQWDRGWAMFRYLEQLCECETQGEEGLQPA